MQFFFVNGIKVDCVTYDMFPWLEDAREEEGVRLAGMRDIAAMKINAITNRGTRKDFVDIAFLLRRFPMSEMFRLYQLKYPDAELSLAVRSLAYFADAEKEPMPRMLIPFDWEAEKERIQEAVRQMF